MMMEVIDAKYEGKYRVWLKFNNGTSGIADLQDDLWGPVFEPLKDLNKFKNFKVSNVLHTIVWDNDADFAPEHLYNKCQYICRGRGT